MQIVRITTHPALEVFPPVSGLTGTLPRSLLEWMLIIVEETSICEPREG